MVLEKICQINCKKDRDKLHVTITDYASKHNHWKINKRSPRQINEETAWLQTQSFREHDNCLMATSETTIHVFYSTFWTGNYLPELENYFIKQYVKDVEESTILGKIIKDRHDFCLQMALLISSSKLSKLWCSCSSDHKWSLVQCYKDMLYEKDHRMTLER